MDRALWLQTDSLGGRKGGNYKVTEYIQTEGTCSLRHTVIQVHKMGGR